MTHRQLDFKGLPTITQPEIIEYSSSWKAEVSRITSGEPHAMYVR